MDDLRLVKAFFQLDTVRGYRYIDDAGRIINKYEVEFPEAIVAGLQGLRMANSGATVEELKVSSHKIWLSFNRPATPAYVSDNAIRIGRDIAKMIAVTHASRFGLRFEYVMSVDDAETAARRCAAVIYAEPFLPPASEVSTFEAMVETKVDDIEMAMRVHPVMRAEGAKDEDIPEFGMMFDMDFYRRGEELPLSEVRKFTRTAHKWLRDSLPEFSARLMSEVAE